MSVVISWSFEFTDGLNYLNVIVTSLKPHRISLFGGQSSKLFPVNQEETIKKMMQ